MSEITSPQWAARLRALTPARVGLGRTGVSQETRDLLAFQLAHALARDAVHARLEAAALTAEIGEISEGEVLRLHSMARDRAQYLQRPDLGRRLNERSRALLTGLSREEWELAIVVADGLSAQAVERHVAPLLREWLQRMEGWRVAPVCVVEQGRVAIGDEIGAALDAHLCVMLIGERPGLSSPDSLGAYITWGPREGITDAQRNCISNIRAEGLSYAQAATQLCFYCGEARRRRLTGVALKEEAHRIEKG
jgi:ethanolamine ammonia-lyase small subunit